MAHEKVFGICENKCKVEVIPMGNFLLIQGKRGISGNPTITLRLGDYINIDSSQQSQIDDSYNWMVVSVMQGDESFNNWTTCYSILTDSDGVKHVYPYAKLSFSAVDPNDFKILVHVTRTLNDEDGDSTFVGNITFRVLLVRVPAVIS